MGARRKALYILIIGLIWLLVAEGVARITSGPRYLNPRYVEASKGFDDFDTLVEDSRNGPGLKYYDEFLYSPATFSSTHINFTGDYTTRLTPDSVPLDEAQHIVWTFGGSTMQNIETSDELTIANSWAGIFNRSLGPTHVKNFGVAGFLSSYELIKFQKLLREVPESELPTLVIFYDGYNDARYGYQYGPGSLQKDLSLKLEALVEEDNVRTSLYTLARELDQHSVLWQRTGMRLAEYWLFPLPEPQPQPDDLDRTVRVYTSNVRMAEATCQTFEIDCYFVLQPLLLTKEPLSPLEQEILDELEAHPRVGAEGIQFVRNFYAQARQELGDNHSFIDASAVLNDREQPDFYDMGHVGANSPPIIAEAIADRLLERLNSVE